MTAPGPSNPSQPKSRPPAIVIGVTRDVFGRPWAVRESTPTQHGFEILSGWPEGRVPAAGNARVGAPRVILTPSLADYLRATPRWIDVRLPIGKNAVVRFRKELDLDNSSQRRRWWAARQSELQRIGPRKFAEKHAVSEAAARRRYCK